MQSFSIHLLNPLISAGIKCLGGNHCFSFSLHSTVSLHLQKLLRYSSVSKRRGKGTQRVPSLSPRAESRTARILYTTFYSSNTSNKHCSYKCLMCLVYLSTQLDIDSMNIPLFLTNPWHIRACWREKRQHCLYWQSPVHQTLVLPVPIHSSTSHSNTAAEVTHSSAMATGGKDSEWPHLPHQLV